MVVCGGECAMDRIDAAPRAEGDVDGADAETRGEAQVELAVLRERAGWLAGWLAGSKDPRLKKTGSRLTSQGRETVRGRSASKQSGTLRRGDGGGQREEDLERPHSVPADGQVEGMPGLTKTRQRKRPAVRSSRRAQRACTSSERGLWRGVGCRPASETCEGRLRCAARSRMGPQQDRDPAESGRRRNMDEWPGGTGRGVSDLGAGGCGKGIFCKCVGFARCVCVLCA
jgi:hypothetical protein